MESKSSDVIAYADDLSTSSMEQGRDVAKTDSRDQVALARMGKQQILKRNFGYLSILSFSCTILITWEGVLVIFASGFLNGGPVGLLGQYFLVWAGTLSTFVVIGELASMAPTAGGQYHWAHMLSPPSIRDIVSYLTGWMTCLAWLGTVATGAFLDASMIQGICLLNWPEYAKTNAPYQTTLITWAIILICVFLNIATSRFLPNIEGAFLIVHILGFFGILIPLLYYAPKGTPSEIFSAANGYLNEGNWPTYGLSFMVGILGIVFAFVGADAAVHMSEEIHNATVNVPRTIVGSIFINGCLGLATLLVVLFCLGDPTAALAAEQTIGYPFMEIFMSATQSHVGTTVMTAIIITMNCAATVGFVATGSRMVWSFARDNGLPFSNALKKVSPRTKIPILAVVVTCAFPCLIALIDIGSTVAFNQVTSLAVAGFYSTYFISCVLLLCHRIRGNIRPYDRSNQPNPSYKDTETGKYVLIWGPWRLNNWFGTMNNIVAVCYLITIWIFAFFPPQTPVNAATMNYSSLVFGAVVLYSGVYYFVYGRRQYKGPVIEIDLVAKRPASG